MGVLCGNKNAMARSDPGKASRVAYVIGTFAGHPAVMGSMNAFLKWHSRPETPALYDAMHSRIQAFITKANASFKEAGYPLELSNWFSVWSMMYTTPGRYHWMLQVRSPRVGSHGAQPAARGGSRARHPHVARR